MTLKILPMLSPCVAQNEVLAFSFFFFFAFKQGLQQNGELHTFIIPLKQRKRRNEQ
jgi:hypothetical protein